MKVFITGAAGYIGSTLCRLLVSDSYEVIGIDKLLFGGSENQCDIVASYLTKFGHDVLYGIVKPRKQSYNVDYGWIPISRPFWVHFSRALKSVNPDVVYWRYNKCHF